MAWIMDATLIIGIVIIVGFICGEIAERMGFPKVTGYILAGIILNPHLVGFIPSDFTASTTPVTNISLAFITFSIGGTLLYSRLKKLGKTIFCIALLESEFAFFAVVAGFLAISWLIIDRPGSNWMATYVPLSLIVGSLGSPTDPAVTLAVAHEYKAKGEVTSTIMGVAASDDALGIINFSLAVALARMCVMHQEFNWYASVASPVIDIAGAIGLGIAFGLALNGVTSVVQSETEGVLIVVILGSLTLCFGIADLLGIEKLLATMTMGFMVVNFNPAGDTIFQIMERYTDDLIFVLFFTISGMYLNITVIGNYWPLVLLFVICRAIGKFSGTALGAHFSGSSRNIKKLTSGGLIPQGGIVVGLALLIRQNSVFVPISDIILNTVLGATVIHELIGPVIAKAALIWAGEIEKQGD